MNLKFQDASLKLSKSDIGHLEAYAVVIGKKMQREHPKEATDWTACIISFLDFKPIFTWMSLSEALLEGTQKNIMVRCKL